MAVYEESNLQEPGSPADKFGSSQGPGYGQDPLGTYQVVDAAVIKSELDLNSEKIGEFQAGELVEVVHIVDLGPVAARVRAHVVDQSRVPIGWISLRNTESGKQWAVHYTGDSAGHHHEGMHGELLHNYDTFNAFPASPPLQVGDWVEWKESDSFVPRGAVGQVLAVQEEEDKVRVRFPQATLFLHPGDTMFVAHENDLHRGVLDSLQGEWRIFEGTTRYPGVMEIRAGGCVIHTDGNHYPQQDLIILNGAIARNDGWSVDMANSTKRELMWFKADSMHSWRKVKALSEYEVGDRVEWTEEANEVPRGTQGVVEQVFDSYCRTKFPGATWDLLPNELLSQGDEPPASPLPQLMSPMGGSAGSLAAAAGGQQTSSPQSQTAKDAAQGLHFEGEDEHQVHPTADYGHQRDDNHRGQRPPPLDTDLGTPMGSTTPAVSLAQAAAASAATAAAAAAVVSGTSPGHSNGEGALHQQVSGQPVSTGDHEHRTVSPGPLTQGTGTTAATPGAATVTTPTEMNTMMYYPPGRNEALLYKLEVDSSQVGSPAHTPTSPPSTNTPPVSPAQLHSGMPPSPGTMGSARHSGPKMSPVREPTNTSSPAGSQAGTQVSAQQSPREKALALATAGAAAGATAAAVAEAETTGKSQGLHQLMFKAATAPISSAKSALSEGIRSARGPSGPKGGGPSDPKGVMSDRRLFTEAADFNDMPEPPPPTPSAETAARGRRVDQSSPKSGSSGKATPKSGASQGSARPNEAGPPKGDTLLDRSKPRRPQTPGTPNRRQFRV